MLINKIVSQQAARKQQKIKLLNQISISLGNKDPQAQVKGQNTKNLIKSKDGETQCQQRLSHSSIKTLKEKDLEERSTITNKFNINKSQMKDRSGNTSLIEDQQIQFANNIRRKGGEGGNRSTSKTPEIYPDIQALQTKQSFYQLQKEDSKIKEKQNADLQVQSELNTQETAKSYPEFKNQISSTQSNLMRGNKLKNRGTLHKTKLSVADSQSSSQITSSSQDFVYLRKLNYSNNYFDIAAYLKDQQIIEVPDEVLGSFDFQKNQMHQVYEVFPKIQKETLQKEVFKNQQTQEANKALSHILKKDQHIKKCLSLIRTKKKSLENWKNLQQYNSNSGANKDLQIVSQSQPISNKISIKNPVGSFINKIHLKNQIMPFEVAFQNKIDSKANTISSDFPLSLERISFDQQPQQVFFQNQNLIRNPTEGSQKSIKIDIQAQNKVQEQETGNKNYYDQSALRVQNFEFKESEDNERNFMNFDNRIIKSTHSNAQKKFGKQDHYQDELYRKISHLKTFTQQYQKYKKFESSIDCSKPTKDYYQSAYLTQQHYKSNSPINQRSLEHKFSVNASQKPANITMISSQSGQKSRLSQGSPFQALKDQYKSYKKLELKEKRRFRILENQFLQKQQLVTQKYQQLVKPLNIPTAQKPQAYLLFEQQNFVSQFKQNDYFQDSSQRSSHRKQAYKTLQMKRQLSKSFHNKTKDDFQRQTQNTFANEISAVQEEEIQKLLGFDQRSQSRSLSNKKKRYVVSSLSKKIYDQKALYIMKPLNFEEELLPTAPQ